MNNIKEPREATESDIFRHHGNLSISPGKPSNRSTAGGTYNRMAMVCSAITTILGTVAMIGWLMDIHILASFGPGYIPIAPGAALAFILLGSALYLYARAPLRWFTSIYALISVLFVSLIALLNLIQFLIGAGVDFEGYLVREVLGLDPGVYGAGPMSPIAAASFLLTCAAMVLLLFAPGRRAAGLSAGLASVVVSVGLVVLLGYLYGTPQLYGGGYRYVALPAGVMFVFLGTALIAAAGPEHFPLRLLVGPSISALLMRSFLLVIFVVILIDGIFHSLFSRLGLTDALRAALSVLIAVAIASIVISQISRVLGGAMDRAEAERKQAEEELKRAKELSDALNSINSAINSTLDFDEIMRKVVVEAGKAIGSDACNITLCKGNNWTVEYTYGLPQQIIGTRFTGEQAVISDLVAATKKPLIIKDILSEERFRRWMLQEYGVRSVLGIPLLMREEVVGVLYFIYFSVKSAFSRSEIDFAEKLSASVSLSMQNARLFEERKRAEEELKKRTEELARSNAELEQFAYIASHDLQEPLRMVSGFTQLLAKRYRGRLDKDADEFIAFIVDGTKRMQRMIEDLLAYSRVGTQGKPFEPVNLEDVFNQVVTSLKVTIEENKAQITHDPLPTVMADASQMAQLFQNLISNAIKFRKKEEPPHIHISAEKKGDEWLFSVRDNGIGIAPEFTVRLFQLFQRAHVAGEYPGTGIGLAICKRIVERHGGRIWAESEEGKGSIFYFTIPAGKSRD
ncbi:MAG: ATP-binding protein [Candidatus Methanoperedens sp.]|nr:ATP-binding protein [Candidatus Methanoperedens sp.]